MQKNPSFIWTQFPTNPGLFSQRTARRNARRASLECGRRRRERQMVEEFLSERV